MIGLDNIKKNIVGENNLNTGWRKDLETSPITYQYASMLAERMLTDGGASGFTDYSYGLFAKDGLSAQINVFPFGKRTKEHYPEFLGVCAGACKLGKLFGEIKEQLKYYMSPKRKCTIDNSEPKSITVFTDKWDPKFLKENEVLFLQAALSHNVVFNFYLVTDYGIERIPFLSKDEMDRLKDKYHKENLEGCKYVNDSISDIISAIGIENVDYYIEQDDSNIPGYKREQIHYHFDFSNLQYRYENSSEKLCSGPINEHYAKEFLISMDKLRKKGTIGDAIWPTNYIKHILTFNGYSFSWYGISDFSDNPEAASVISSLDKMIKTLGKK